MQTLRWQQHRWLNHFQTLFLILVLLAICSLAGSLLFGEQGLWIALFSAGFGLIVTPLSAWRLTLHLYRAHPIASYQAPQLWQNLAILAERAGLPDVPKLYYLPSPVVNAFAVGSRSQSAIALSNGLLQHLSLRELTGVLAHETAHIANNDLRVMGLADSVSRITALLAATGQLYLVLMIPFFLISDIPFQINWPGILLLISAPHLALLVQLGLSRTREYNADLNAAYLSGDPLGLAQALLHIEQASRGWWAVLLPGWGNPQPSWLRSHPATQERIRRLQALQPRLPSQPGFMDSVSAHDYPVQPLLRPPYWRFGGLWR